MTASKQTAPAGLTAVTNALHVACEGPVRVGDFETFTVDFSACNLSLGDQTPCIWLQGCGDADPAQSAAALQAAARRGGWHNSTILVFVDGETAVLRRQISMLLPRFVFFDAAEQASMATAVAPVADLLAFLQNKLSRLELAPYETNKPVTGSRFFGREAEIQRVLNNPATSYLFVGIRRIGKTSLLKEIKRRLDEVDPPQPGQVRRVYIDCTVLHSEEALLRAFMFHLAQNDHGLLAGRAQQSAATQQSLLDRFVAEHGAPITILLDEFDRLVPHMSVDWPLLQVLRTAVEAGQMRFILAGFRNAMSAATGLQSPFAALITPVRLEPLTVDAVQAMVLNPLTQLGIAMNDAAGMVHRIHAETAGLPNYIQFYCHILLRRLEAGDRDELRMDDLDAVPQDETFRNFVINTFMSNTELLERAIVYALVAEGEAQRPFRFAQDDILEWLGRRQLLASVEQVEAACRNLEMAGVLRREGAEFKFAVPLFPHMLRQMRNVSFLFTRAREALQTEKILA